MHAWLPRATEIHVGQVKSRTSMPNQASQLGSIVKKLLSCLADFGRYGGWGGFSGPVNEGKFVTNLSWR